MGVVVDGFDVYTGRELGGAVGAGEGGDGVFACFQEGFGDGFAAPAAGLLGRRGWG